MHEAFVIRRFNIFGDYQELMVLKVATIILNNHTLD